MKRWTVIVPLKSEVGRKSRLAHYLTARERCELSNMLFERVMVAIAGCPAVTQLVVLAPEAPSGWTGALVIDRCRGLNQELAEAALAVGERDLAVIHADLPTLAQDDVSRLLAEAEASGSAIAPDRHGTGTNALAMQLTRSFRFSFGMGSFALHTAQLPGSSIVHRPGFSFDLDTREDFDLAIKAGVIAISERFVYA